MNTFTKISLLSFALVLTLVQNLLAQTPLPQSSQMLELKNNWTKQELMEPAKLAALLKNPGSAKPLIFNIGVVDNIKGAKNIGAADKKENLVLFRKALTALPKTAAIVIYCGCCPFGRCPNIRPAFQVLKDAGFSNAKLLNLPTNLKTDWINKGYPIAKSE
jgi:hypothetical protein